MMAEPILAPAATIEEGRVARVHIRPTRAGNIAARPQPRLESASTVKPILLAQYSGSCHHIHFRSHVASLGVRRLISHSITAALRSTFDRELRRGRL